MKWVVVAGFLLCFANDIHAGAIQSSNLPEGKECLPGTRWKSQCNECTCSDDGMAACTEQLCEGYEDAPVLRCLPDTNWKNDCNTCRCSSKGVAYCTRKGCGFHIITDFHPEGEVNKEENSSTPDTENDVTYIVNEDFDDYENHEVTKRSVCEPNERFEVDCNSCKCDSNGQTYSCTKSECLEMDMDKEVEVFKESEGADHVERHTVCKPRATFHVGCNTCTCNIAGTDFICATKPCPLLNDVELFHEIKAVKSQNNTKAIVCAANRMFVKDCNTCWCNEDGTGYFCTRKVCVPEFPEDATTEGPEPELKVIKRECRPDEVFELDCNMCRCNPDGKSFSCTRRACVLEEDAKNTSLLRVARATSQASSRSDATASRLSLYVKETPKICQPGQEFRMDCNTCLCDNMGQNFSCTRIDCAALNNNNNGGARRKREATTQVTTDCTPGSVFEQGCKMCRCLQDGKHAVCPARCQNEEHTENEVSNTDSDPSFRCNPGEQFKRSCNDCTCSADGRSYFCTLRLCEEEITPTI